MEVVWIVVGLGVGAFLLTWAIILIERLKFTFEVLERIDMAIWDKKRRQVLVDKWLVRRATCRGMPGSLGSMLTLSDGHTAVVFTLTPEAMTALSTGSEIVQRVRAIQ